MPELHQILGSLFSDIAQSIFTSDLYSRDISRYYEQDGLLRHFPVPRTEISELEVDLKFAIAQVELNPTQGIEREAGAATVFVDFTYSLAERFLEALHDILVEMTRKGRVIENEVIQQSESGVIEIYLRQDLLRFFQHHQINLIEKGNYQKDIARGGVIEILQKYIAEITGDKLAAEDKNEILNQVVAAIGLESKLDALEEPLRFAWDSAGDFKMDVEVTADKLLEMDSGLLSTVHVKTRVRNYKWSEVEHQGLRKWWTLNPE